MKKIDMRRSRRQAVITTAIFFIAFCRIVSAQDVFEAKNPVDPGADEETSRVRVAKQTDVKQRPESPAVPEPGKPVTADDMRKAFEMAIKAVDAGKLEEEKRTEDLLQDRFRIAVENWITAAGIKRAPDLNKMVDQKWEKLYEFGPYIYYDYYLKDYEFLEKGSDIIKTDSMVTPYRSYLNAVEKLYVEKYHTPDISYIEDFLYTVTYPIKVNMEYRGNKFVIARQ